MTTSTGKAVPAGRLASRRHVVAAAALLLAQPYIRRLFPRPGVDPGIIAGVELLTCGSEFVTVAAQVPASPYCGLVARTPATTPPSWCVPTAPWYYLDNGGNSCVCERRWDAGLYASKVWLAVGYDVPHTLMNINLYVFLQSVERTLLASLLNEVIEELLVMVYGSWGFARPATPAEALTSIQAMETRYDSLIRDVLLCGLPGIVVGYIVVVCSGAVPFLVGAWPQFAASVLMYFFLSGMHSFYFMAADVDRFYPGNLVLIVLYVAALGGVWRVCGRHEPPELFAYWFVAVAALLLPSVYPWATGLARVCYSAALATVTLLAVHYVAGQWRARPAAGAPALDAPVSLGDVATGTPRALARPWQAPGQRRFSPYGPYALVLFALGLVVLAENRFFVYPVPDAVAFASDEWCGLGMASDVARSRLGGSACDALRWLRGD
jgi:hypothetical protein